MPPDGPRHDPGDRAGGLVADRRSQAWPRVPAVQGSAEAHGDDRRTWIPDGRTRVVAPGRPAGTRRDGTLGAPVRRPRLRDRLGSGELRFRGLPRGRHRRVLRHSAPSPLLPRALRRGRRRPRVGMPDRHRRKGRRMSATTFAWSLAARNAFSKAEGRPLFHAGWRRTVFIHYEVDPAALQPQVPFPLETRDGKAYVSLVASTLSHLRLA